MGFIRIACTVSLYLGLGLVSRGVPLDESGEVPAVRGVAWRVAAADSALRLGLWGIAESYYSKLFEGEDVDPNTRQYVGLRLASSLISQNKAQEAKVVLSGLPDRRDNGYRLRLAMVYFIENDYVEADRSLGVVVEGSLVKEDMAWYYLLKGLVVQEQKGYKAAREFFEKAKANVQGDGQMLEIESVMSRGEIYEGKATDAVLRGIKKKVTRFLGKGQVPLDLMKQYAVILDMTGQKEEAVKQLKNRIKKTSSRAVDEAQEMRLLIGLIAGPESGEGQRALEDLLRKGGDRKLVEQALWLLVKGRLATKGKSELIQFLEEILASKEYVASGGDTVMLIRMQLALESGELGVSGVLAKSFLERYPGSRYKDQALRVLAYFAWSDEPPRYRLAANYLRQLGEVVDDEDELLNLKVLRADCYYLNSDYETAANLYKEAIYAESGSLDRGQVLYQLVLAELGQGNWMAAKADLDQWRRDSRVDPMNLWRAEWNLISQMKLLGEFDLALARVRRLVDELPDAAMSVDLAMRLIWLKAELSMEAGEPGVVPALAEQIIGLIETYGFELMDSDRRNQIISHTLLLKAQALLENGSVDEGLGVLERIRNEYPDGKAAILSHIAQARYYVRENRMVDAQQALIDLSDKYPDSEYVPVALYEAALSAEVRGLGSTYQEALSILERLVKGYPDSPLVYYARLKQGDLLRKLNDFSSAQLVYEEMLKRYSGHEQQYRVEMARADSLLAQAGNDNSRLKDVSVVYERLMDLTSISTEVRIEAGYKAGFAMKQALDWGRAEELLWMVLTEFLIDREASDPVGVKGRYWLSRSIFELGGLLRQQGKYKQSQEVYALVDQYHLPGLELAQARMQ